MKSKWNTITPDLSLQVLVFAAALALILSAAPLTASAASASTVAEAINGYASQEHASLRASVTGATVRVTGSVYGAGNQLSLNIPSGTSVVWEAYFENWTEEGKSIVSISGNGAFNVEGDAGIINGGTGSAVAVTGGTPKITVNGGMVSATAGNAIYAPGTGASVTVNGGIVCAASGYAVYAPGVNSTVTVNGGFVFAYGMDITGEGNVIGMRSGAEPVIGGEAVVCAWNEGAGVTGYTAGSTTDLTVSPEGASARWGTTEVPFGSPIHLAPVGGFSFANGINTGFYIMKFINVSSLSIYFELNGGSGVQTVNVLSGDLPEKPDDPVREGFRFAGWFTNTIMTAPYFFSEPVTSDVFLYAKWYAVDNPSMSNFVPVNDFESGQFSDVSPAAWYIDSLATTYRYNLMRGSSADEFSPSGEITIAQAITIATRIHCIYFNGVDEFPPVKPGEPWYQENVNYAIEHGIIAEGAFADYGHTATRAEMMYIISRSLPEGEFPPSCIVNSLPDVTAAMPYGDAIFMMYRAGILAGNDTRGTFNPNAKITRAETSVIISRVIIPGARFTGRSFG